MPNQSEKRVEKAPATAREKSPPPLSLLKRMIMGHRRGPLSERRWFSLQFKPHEALRRYGIPLPSLPPDEVQERFTGMSGRANLLQAFSFYTHIVEKSPLRSLEEPAVLDFGGGWGRIARFFLRDTAPSRIWIADCLSDSIHWLHKTGNPCRIIQNNPCPPIPEIDAHFDIIYSFSVFSHLSPEIAAAWLDYLLEQLAPKGCLIVTTRGKAFIEGLERRQESDFARLFPPAREVYQRYKEGTYQFYPTGGGGELSSNFYGEAIIPHGYFKDRYGTQLIEFNEAVPRVDQAVIILKKS